MHSNAIFRVNQEKYFNFCDEYEEHRCKKKLQPSHDTIPLCPLLVNFTNFISARFLISRVLSFVEFCTRLLFLPFFNLTWVSFNLLFTTFNLFNYKITLTQGCFGSDMNSVRNPDPDPAFHFKYHSLLILRSGSGPKHKYAVCSSTSFVRKYDIQT